MPAARSSQTVFPSLNGPGAAPQRAAYKAPVLLDRVNPVYPPAAREAHVTGTVRVNAVIGKEGIPHSLKVLSGDPRLAPAAIAAVSQWLYQPAQINGQDVDSELTVEVQFNLQ